MEQQKQCTELQREWPGWGVGLLSRSATCCMAALSLQYNIIGQAGIELAGKKSRSSGLLEWWWCEGWYSKKRDCLRGRDSKNLVFEGNSKSGFACSRVSSEQWYCRRNLGSSACNIQPLHRPQYWPAAMSSADNVDKIGLSSDGTQRRWASKKLGEPKEERGDETMDSSGSEEAPKPWPYGGALDPADNKKRGKLDVKHRAAKQKVDSMQAAAQTKLGLVVLSSEGGQRSGT